MEHVPPASAPLRTAESVTDAMRLQILATEHWGLLAHRSMIWNEIFTRASMFLTTVSASLVALALIAQVTDFDASFRTMALLVLPVVLFLAVATYIRLVETIRIDAWTVMGMNRLRHAYIEIAPDLEPYFVTSQYDDVQGMMISAGSTPHMSVGQVLSGTLVIVAVVCAVISGVIAALILDGITDRFTIQLAAGLVVTLVVTVILVVVTPMRSIAAMTTEWKPRFPSPAVPRS